jgi:hypothetical protein
VSTLARSPGSILGSNVDTCISSSIYLLVFSRYLDSSNTAAPNNGFGNQGGGGGFGNTTSNAFGTGGGTGGNGGFGQTNTGGFNNNNALNYQAEVEKYLKHINPSKLHTIPQLMQKYQGNEKKLIDKLKKKYMCQHWQDHQAQFWVRMLTHVFLLQFIY